MANPKSQQAKGNWKQFKGQLRESWGSLTDDELDRYQGKREQLEGYIQEKTGEDREAIRQRIDQMSRDLKYSF